MSDEPIHGEQAGDKADNPPKNEPVAKRNTFFDWSFFAEHPGAIWLMLIGGIAVSPIVDFPGGEPRRIYWIAFGLVCFLALGIWFVADAIVARMEGREFLTKQAIDKTEQDYKDGIQTQFKDIEVSIGEAKKQIASQGPRYLTASQKQAIKEAISPYSGQDSSVLVLMWDTEANRYAQDFVAVLSDAKWKCGPSAHASFPIDFDNVDVLVKKVDHIDDVPPAALALQHVLISLRLIKDDGMIHFADDIKDGEVTIRVGVRPTSWPNSIDGDRSSK